MKETITQHTEDEQVVKTTDGWYEVVTKDNEGIATTHRLYKHSTETRPDRELTEEDFISQAAPVRIAPRRTKPAKREHKIIAAFGDEQIDYRDVNGELVPTHDEGAMHAVRGLLRALKPDLIVGLGDGLDMSNLSRYSPDSDHSNNRTLQAGLDRLHQWDAELRADHPVTDIVRMEGNHNRLTAYVLKNAKEIYGIKRAGGDKSVLSLPYLVGADETGVEYITGYPANEFRYSDDLVFVHGNRVRSNGSTAELMSKAYPDRNVVFGHVHRHERHTATTHLGKYVTAITFGGLMRIDGVVPSYGNGVDDDNVPVPRYENWQNGMGIIEDYGDGEYHFESVLIHNGVIRYKGQEYS